MNKKRSEWVKAFTYVILAILVPLGVANPVVVGAVSAIGEQVAEHLESEVVKAQMKEGLPK